MFELCRIAYADTGPGCRVVCSAIKKTIEIDATRFAVVHMLEDTLRNGTMHKRVRHATLSFFCLLKTGYPQQLDIHFGN